VSLPNAAGVVQTCRVGIDADTGRAKDLHLLRGVVRDVAVECERLVEPNGVRVAPTGKLRALDLGRSFAKNTAAVVRLPIFHVGAPGQSMMVILNGTVRVSLPGPRGKGVILDDLPAGELLGEVALLDGKERSADATALTKCELVGAK
jgi:hypothetical protein